MTVLELIKACLLNMNESDDTESVGFYREEILRYINEGYIDAVVSRMRPVRSVACVSRGGKIPFEQIGSDFFETVRVIDENGIEAQYYCDGGGLFINDGNYKVEYIFVPEKLFADMDQPILPDAYHYILSDYSTYRMFLKGSKGRQSRGDAFLQSYLNGLSKISGVKSTRIKNKFGCDING